MPDLPINRRPIPNRAYRTFLSHAYVDKEFVDKLYIWLTEFANMRVWYDSIEFPNGLMAAGLGAAIENCQSAILVLSNDSVERGWVQKEWEICVGEENDHPDFQIVMLKLDNCDPPPMIRVRKWINVEEKTLTPQVACSVLEGLHGYSTRPSETAHAAFYLARGNRAAEVERSERLLRRCRQLGYRFIRDAPDQKDFTEQRIKDIIASTSGVFAFVPKREGGTTSEYILKEIRFAKEMNVPGLIVLDPGLSDETKESVVLPDRNIVVDAAACDAEEVEEGILEFMEHVPRPLRGAHCFVGHALSDEQRELWKMARKVVEATSGLPCFSGDELTGDNAQQQIVEAIRRSAISIFDITDDRLNSCIEAGIARGAGGNYELVCKGPRRTPKPFMFNDKQVFFYETPSDLLGLMRRLVFRVRRVVC